LYKLVGVLVRQQCPVALLWHCCYALLAVTEALHVAAAVLNP
jgi:hypothetical protein